MAQVAGHGGRPIAGRRAAGIYFRSMSPNQNDVSGCT